MVESEINIGDKCVCTRGIVGIVNRIIEVDGRKIYFGKTLEGKNWQSVKPEKIKYEN